MAGTSYIQGNLMLLRFYLRNINTIRSLPIWMRNPDIFRAVVETKLKLNQKSFSLSVPSSIGKQYNADFEDMKSKMRRLHSGENELFDYKITLFLLFCIRAMCIISAWYGNVMATVLLSSIQFVVAPYSLFVSAALAVALAPPIYASHYIAFNLLQSSAALVSYFVPPSIISFLANVTPYLYLTIGPAFIISFFVLDQGMCFYCHYFTPSKSFTTKETLVHVVWGFLNTKTYTLVILLHMMNSGVSIPLWIWVTDAYLQVTPKIADKISKSWMHWLELFYHQHRMAHLPKVYEHAHKLHHYLHGTIAFDAHIYGNGMPEEFFFMLLELLAGTIYGQMPATLNRNILQYSFDNKLGHTQKPEDTCGDNFHADHHIFHTKNFGIYNSLMDMYFSTSTNNEKYMIKPTLFYSEDAEVVFKVEKKEEGCNTVFYFSPNVVAH